MKLVLLIPNYLVLGALFELDKTLQKFLLDLYHISANGKGTVRQLIAVLRSNHHFI